MRTSREHRGNTVFYAQFLIILRFMTLDTVRFLLLYPGSWPLVEHKLAETGTNSSDTGEITLLETLRNKPESSLKQA